jgi:hypothetical protein
VKPFRAQLVNVENGTAVWFEFGTEAEAKGFAYRLNQACTGQPVSALVGSYPADAICPRKKL